MPAHPAPVFGLLSLISISLLSFLASCNTHTVRYTGLAVGDDIDTLMTTFPDAKLATEELELDLNEAVETPDTEGAVQYLRTPHDQITERFIFKEDELLGVAVEIKDPKLVPQIIQILEEENGVPMQRSAMGTSITFWEGGDAQLMLFKTPKKAFIMLKREGKPANAWLLALMSVLYAIGLVNLFSERARFQEFLKTVPRIELPEHMVAFQKVAARSMYGALGQLVVLLSAGGACMWGIHEEQMGTVGVPLNVALAGIVIATAFKVKRIQTQVRETPSAEAYLMPINDVIRTWEKKPLPDW